MEHLTLRANGASFHVARTGTGPALLLLHGWPEFWLTWEPVMTRLADRFTLYAPDLRGFGASDKPDGPWGNQDVASDMLALLDALKLEQVGCVGHDVGGGVMQPLARMAPERFSGLFLFDFFYPQVGERAGTPDRLAEIWYQSFHLLDLAPELIGSSREACRAYIGHFLRHWSNNKHAFDDVLEAFVDNFLAPGNLLGGFQYYRGAQEHRLEALKGKAEAPPPIDVPACVRWGKHDPVLPVEWTDRVGEVFSDLDLAVLPDVGHFPHREDPDLAAREIGTFFTRIGRGGR